MDNSVSETSSTNSKDLFDIDKIFSSKSSNADTPRKRKVSDTDTRLMELFGGTSISYLSKNLPIPTVNNLSFLEEKFSTVQDNSNPMTSYLSSSFGVSGSSLFDDDIGGDLFSSITPKQKNQFLFPSTQIPPKNERSDVVNESKIEISDNENKQISEVQNNQISKKQSLFGDEDDEQNIDILSTLIKQKTNKNISASEFRNNTLLSNKMESPSIQPNFNDVNNDNDNNTNKDTNTVKNNQNNNEDQSIIITLPSSSPSSSLLSLQSSNNEDDSDLPKTTMSFSDMSLLIRDADYGKTTKFSNEILKLAEKDHSFEKLLQPYRDLISEYTGLIEIQETLQIEKKMFRSSKTNNNQPITRVSTKACRLFLFSDQLTIYTTKLEDSIPLEQLWIKLQKFSNNKKLTSSNPSSSSSSPSSSPLLSSSSSSSLSSLSSLGSSGAHHDVFSKALTSSVEHAKTSFYLTSPEKRYLCIFNSEEKVQQFIVNFNETLVEKKIVENEESLSKRKFKYKFKDSSVYDGEWKNRKFHGFGKHLLLNGDSFEGKFLNHKRSGFGIFSSSELRYEGFWDQNMKNGKGCLFFHSDKFANKFIGSWVDDQPHGEGELYLNNASILKCIWKLGVRSNPVILCFDGKSRYIGDISEEYLQNGHGICVYGNGDRYYGSWVNGEKSGSGMYISAKGTQFFGEWLNDKINGHGSLRSAKDESTLVGKFTGNLTDSLDITNGNFKFHQIDTSTTSHRISTINGEKWDCFFKMRLKVIDNSEQIQVLNETLKKSILSDNQQQIRDDLFQILYCRKHALGKLIAEFESIFLALYHKADRHFLQLRSAVDDIQSFLNLMSADFIRQFLNCESLVDEDCSEALHSALFPTIYDCLFNMYLLYYEEKDKVIDRKFLEIQKFSLREIMAVCGIEEKYWEKIEILANQDNDKENFDLSNVRSFDIHNLSHLSPFNAAVICLRKLYEQKTVHGKLECIKMAASNVEALLKSLVKTFGADEFLPIFCMLMMVANTPKIESEIMFIEDFMAEEIQFSVYGYMLAQLQIATSFLNMCDLNNAKLAHKNCQNTK